MDNSRFSRSGEFFSIFQTLSGQKPLDKKPPNLKPLIGITIKEVTSLKYYCRTVIFRTHAKGSSASRLVCVFFFCAILSENSFLTNEKLIFNDIFDFFFSHFFFTQNYPASDLRNGQECIG